MRAAYGSFTKPISPTNQNSVSGLGFRPDCLILWGSTNTSDGSAAHFVQSIGFSDGVNHYSVCGTSEDATGGVSDADRRHALKGITFLDFTVTVIAECDVQFDSDGFTLDWTTNDANGYVIHYLALEGVVCEVGWFSGGNIAGNQDIATTVIPDLRANKTALFIISSAITLDPPSDQGFVAQVYGAALSASEEATVSSTDENLSNPTDNRRYFGDAAIYTPLAGATDVIAKEATFTDFDGLPNPGFSWNWGTVTASIHRIGYCLLVAKESGSFRFVNATQPTVTGRQIFPLMQVPTPFDPVGAVLASISSTLNNTVTQDSILSFGGGQAGDPGGGVWAGAEDAVSDDTNCAQRTDQAKALMLKDTIDLLAPDAECDLALSTKEVALDWTTVDASARDFWMLVFGNESGDDQPMPVHDFGLRRVPGRRIAY